MFVVFSRRAICTFIVAVAVIAAVPASLPAAVPPYALLKTFAGNGTGKGELDSPKGVAINPVNGDVYVADTNNNRVMRYDSEGNFIWARGWGVKDHSDSYQTCFYTDSGVCYGGLKGDNNGQFNGPQGVAVDYSGSYLYIADTNNKRDAKMTIDNGQIYYMKFLTGGSTTSSTSPLKVVASSNSSHVYIVDNNTVRKSIDGTNIMDDSGDGNNWIIKEKPGDQYGFSSLALSNDSSTLYAIEYSDKFDDRVISYFTEDGKPASWQAITADAPIGELKGVADDVAVDKEDNVYVADPSKNHIQIYGNTNGEGIGTIDLGEGGNPVAIAIAPPKAPNAGKVYIADGDKIKIYAPATAPKVTTKDATNITSTSATLNGYVDPGDETGEFSFKYWKDGSSSSTATFVDAGSSTTAKDISNNVTGLEPNTKYKFHIKGVNKNFTELVAFSEVKTFTTSKVPSPVVTTKDATNVQSKSATLNGSVDPGYGTAVFSFKYWKEGSLPTTTTVVDAGSSNTAKDISKNVTGLASNTKYNFHIKGVNIIFPELVAFSEVKTFTTSAVAPKVTTKEATNITSTSATLNGYVDPGDGTGEFSFKYWKDGSSSSTATVVDAGSSTTAKDISKNVIGLEPNTKYNFHIKGVNKNFTELVAFSEVKTFTTSKIDAPAVAPKVTTKDATNISSTSATLNGYVDPGDGTGEFSFKYWKDGSSSSTANVVDAGSSTTAKDISKNVTGLEPNTIYKFHIKGVNETSPDLVAFSEVKTFTTLAASGAATGDPGPGGGQPAGTGSGGSGTSGPGGSQPAGTGSGGSGASGPGGGQTTGPWGPGTGQPPGGTDTPLLQKGCQSTDYQASASASRTITLRQLAGKGGVTLDVTSNLASSISATMSISGKVARRAGLKGSGKLARVDTYSLSGSKRINLKLSKAKRKRLAKALKRKRLPATVKVTIITVVHELTGNRTVKLPLTLNAKRKGWPSVDILKNSKSIVGC